jgi:hypothetical protein
MTSSKDFKHPEKPSYSERPEYIEHVDKIISSYESPDGVMGELVRQLADAMWWVKTYQKDKDHLIVMRMATCLVGRHIHMLKPFESSGSLFDALLISLKGQSVATEGQAYLEQKLTYSGHSLGSLRAEAIGKSIKELEVVDRLIERQFKNMRLLMQAYESVRFAPQLLKKMSLEIIELEQRVEQSYEDQRRKVSRQ